VFFKLLSLGQSLTELESITRGWSNDHDKGHQPFKRIGSNGSSEWLGGNPEVGVRKHALSAEISVNICSTVISVNVYSIPSDLADHSRRANQDGKQVSKGAEQHKNVERGYRTSSTKDGGEEHGSGNLFGCGELRLGN
jgi:hypothetical protein